MHLARVNDAAENTFLTGQVGANSWIGANDQASEGQWRWVDNGDRFWTGTGSGTPYNGLYSRWASPEPNDLFGEDCGELRPSDGKWNDTPCSMTRAFVCESSPATAQAPPTPARKR
jgi:hypothetical protein